MRIHPRIGDRHNRLSQTALLHASAVLLTSLLLIACSKPGAGAECAKTDQAGGPRCAKGLVCYTAGSGPGTCLSKAKAHERCRASDRCRIGGGCTYHAGIGNCISTEPADCQKSEACRKRGKCTLRRKACVAATDADCKQSALCKERGLCKVQPDLVAGMCVKGP